MPARISVLLAIFLAICAATAFVFAILNRDAAHPYEFVSRFAIIGVLLVLIPIVVYYSLRLWLEGGHSAYPDIDDAWQQGLEALQQNGLQITNIPLFLVLGASDDGHADAVMNACGFDFVVSAIPTGRAPLRWYANDDAIYLFCTDLGCLSRLNNIAKQAVGGSSKSADITGTLVSGGIMWTAVPDMSSSDAAGPIASPSIQGTLVPGIQSTLAADSQVPPQSNSMLMTRRMQDEQTERLRYLCDRINRVRQPLCPLNGVMTLLAMESIRNIVYAREMSECVQRDLASVRESTRLCASTTVLVTGMESEPGFSELVRRVGVDRAKSTRFGKGFQIWNKPSTENLDALSSHACGAFEDWVYTLFREQDGLSKPGNAKLYAMLCRIRSELQLRLKHIIQQGYSDDGQPESGVTMFAGCYFAATGASTDRQAFVRSTFEKMVQLEEDLQWTESALSEDRRFHRFARMGMVFNGILVLAIVGIFAMKYLG
ncbi:MAG: hypothetical protein R3C28_13990 [Pirellulaceae bacterium]